MKKLATCAALLGLAGWLHAGPICSLGLTKCIKTQGTMIPVKRAIEVADECSHFTAGDVGRRALQMSQQQMTQVFNRHGITPVVRAWHAYDLLHDSELKFDRSIPIESRYASVKAACTMLDRDFNDQSKWTK